MGTYWDAAPDAEAGSPYLNRPLRSLAQVLRERATGPEALATMEAEACGEPYVRTALDCLHSAASSLWRINQCERHMMAGHLLNQAAASLREAARLANDTAIIALADDCRKAGEGIGWPHVEGLYERARDLEARERLNDMTGESRAIAAE